MAGLNQALGGTALTGFTLNEIIKQQQRGSRQWRNRCSTTWFPVYSLFGFFLSKANECLLHSSCSLVLWRAGEHWRCVKCVHTVFMIVAIIRFSWLTCRHRALADVNAELLHRAVTHVGDGFESKEVDSCWQGARTGYFLAWIYIRSNLLSFILLLSAGACQCSKLRYTAKFGRFTNLSIPRHPAFLHFEVMDMPSVSQHDALM